MNISPTQNHSIGHSSLQSNSNSDHEIKLLQDQKIRAQEKIDKIKQGDAPQKVKQELIKPLQEQIQQIDMQIHEKQMEKINKTKEIEEKQEKNPPQQEGVVYSPMNNLLEASAIYSQSKVLNGVKKDLKGQSNILKIEAKLDGGRMGGGGSDKLKKASALDQKIHQIENKIDKKIKKTQESIEKSYEEEDSISAKKKEEEEKSIHHEKLNILV
ncbi:FlxA-like family protein [Inediibacterium massiliense]|uniref:FlxA-like family protein n=1 Tax=Inediibacterium massiliense TaxID=1658111 RepID=UPI0006B6634E|nr:FlxA-like family protein [Inediibacterium massiliense]